MPINNPALGIAASPSWTSAVTSRDINPVKKSVGSPCAAAEEAPSDAVSIGNVAGGRGSDVDVDAAAGATPVARSNSRRLAAATVHANGAATGEPSEPPEANHDHNDPPKLAAGATRAAVITGADATGGDDTSATPPSGTDTPKSPAATDTESSLPATADATSGTRTETVTSALAGTDADPDTPEAGTR